MRDDEYAVLRGRYRPDDIPTKIPNPDLRFVTFFYYDSMDYDTMDDYDIYDFVYAFS